MVAVEEPEAREELAGAGLMRAVPPAPGPPEGDDSTPVAAGQRPRWEHEFSFPATTQQLRAARRRIGAFAEVAGLDESGLFELNVAVAEALANAVVHGSPRGADDDVHVRFFCYEDQVAVEVVDGGAGMDASPSARAPAAATSGRGIHFMRALADAVHYTCGPLGTRVLLVKDGREGGYRRPPGGPRSGEGRGRMKEQRLILLVEDNDDDVELTLRALRRNRVANRVDVVRDGAEALEYLFATGAYAGRDIRDTPNLVLLDLKLPKVGGLEVLERLRADPRTRRLPVVVLTSSNVESDLARSYDLGANSYIRKPVDFTQFSGGGQPARPATGWSSTRPLRARRAGSGRRHAASPCDVESRHGRPATPRPSLPGRRQQPRLPRLLRAARDDLHQRGLPTNALYGFARC